MLYEEKEISIGEVEQLLNSGEYNIEVESPDGYVEITKFVNKGMYQEHILKLTNGIEVRCNEDHLFETIEGWKYSKNIVNQICKFVTKFGIVDGVVSKTDNYIPIVDIQVNHDNHRYYTNGVSSHNTGVGKTMFMTHCAAANLMDGKNVLYITMEMAEERIAERIDANLLNTKLDDLIKLNAEDYAAKVAKVKARTVGKLIIKEYPTGSANASHFRYLLNELKLKKNFTPDIIFIDYLNICSSSRVKSGGSTSSYSLIKSIAEELRGLAVEFKLPIITATQTNRAGFSDSDIGLEATSDSFGLPMTADLMFALITSEELEELNQICVKQLKNRYTDVTKNKRFNIGVERAKMRFYDVEQSAQDFGEANSAPVFERGSMSNTFKDFFNKN